MLAQDERLTRVVGAIAIAVLAAAIAFFVFAADAIELGGPRTRLRAYFVHTGGLREGAPVIAGGSEIGRVAAIEPARGGPLGDTSGVVVTLALDAGAAARIARGGDVFIAGKGPLAPRFVELGPAPDPEAPRLADGDEVRGSDPPTLDRVLQRTWDNLTIAREFARAVGPEFTALRAQLAALAAHLDELTPARGRALGPELDALIGELRRLRDDTLGGAPGLARIAAVVVHARATLAEAREVIATLRGRLRGLAAGIDAVRARAGDRAPEALAELGRAIDRTRETLDRLDPLLAKIADVQARIERGEGSLMRLARDPEFPEDAKELGKIMKRQPWKIFARPKD